MPLPLASPMSNMPTHPPVMPSASTIPSMPQPPNQVPKETGTLSQRPFQPTAPPAPIQAHPSDVQKSPFRFLPLILGGLVFFAVLVLGITKLFGGGGSATGPSIQKSSGIGGGSGTAAAKTVVTYWGLWEPSTVLQNVINDFQAQNPTISINYVQQAPQQYRERLQAALQQGNGPDIFRYHATWVPMLAQQLDPVPTTAYSPTEFQQTFYPVMAKDLQMGSSYAGIPLMFDGLALYYNKQMLTAAGKTPPKTWQDLETLAKSLTVRGKDGTIQRSGIALGTADNIDNFSDIFGLLLLQNGADPSSPTNTLSTDAMTYYTNFSKVDKVWDSTLPNSTYAFATEKTAMVMLPSWRMFEIKDINPNLSFGVAEVPQLPGDKVTWASYWVEGVSRGSKNKDAAWKFLKYLSGKDALQKFYTSASSARLFGEIPSRVDMADQFNTDPNVGPFVTSASSAKSWYLASRTFDNGLNDRIIKYYQDAVNTVLGVSGVSITEAMTTAQTGIQQILQQFGLFTASAATPRPSSAPGI